MVCVISTFTLKAFSEMLGLLLAPFLLGVAASQVSKDAFFFLLFDDSNEEGGSDDDVLDEE